MFILSSVNEVEKMPLACMVLTWFWHGFDQSFQIVLNFEPVLLWF
jgi:hypothetical protein